VKVGLSEVAEAAGVSEATVSRVLNNRGTVAARTRRTVEEAAQRLGYGSRNTSKRVVLLITPGLESPFFGLLCDRISAQLGTQGLQAVTASAPAGGAQEVGIISAMADLGVAAVVFVSASNTLRDADPALRRLLESRAIPYLTINGSFAGSGAPDLSTNDELASHLAVNHLWELGHRRIGMIAGPLGNNPSDRRAAGFARALDALGARPGNCPVVHTEYSVEGGASAAGRLLEDGATAIVAASDQMALGALRVAERGGLRVPGDLSVVGYDDVLPLDFTRPALTTVRQPVDRLARALLPLVLRVLQPRRADTPAPTTRPAAAAGLVFDPELITRASTAPPPRRTRQGTALPAASMTAT
jgi:LacI family repressor for deo operon, udp, cdd, tsx, nupC, and nupG